MAQLMSLPLTVSCSSKFQIGFTFLVPAYPGYPGKEAVKWLLLNIEYLKTKKSFVVLFCVIIIISYKCFIYLKCFRLQTVYYADQYPVGLQAALALY